MPASTATGTDSDLDRELTAERAHLTESRAALGRMRERARALFATGENVAGDAYSAETLGRALARRVAELADNPDTPLFFGKLTFGAGAGEHANTRHHIGRRHVTDDLGEPIVLDWRAPISRSFYRASARDPQGVTVRRRFGFQQGSLTSFEDEHLDRGEELGTQSKILTNEIERPRVGPMRDIVATIQPEQDELVRADLDQTICVQGAPGTGKTAVGLHRAAYLLYLHRERLRRSGVLILGPNRAFLHYIASVLPALGEIDVAQSTVEEMVGRAISGRDEPAAAALKHDIRMATILKSALRGYVRKPTESIMVSDGSYRWRLGEEVLRRLVDDVRRENPPHAIGRERLRARVVSLLQRQAEAKSGDSPGEAWVRRMSRTRSVTAFLDATWPAVSPEDLVFSLLSNAEVLARAAGDVLDEAEQAALRWTKPPRTARTAAWSAADAILLDEAAGLIDLVPGYGHIVVDEAQDLSPMQCRAVARRSEHGSITLLGDLAQGTAPWAARDWRESLGHLGKPDAAVVPLTVGFRVPAAVVALANRLLPELDVHVPEATSLRRDGALGVHPVGDLDGATVATVTAALDHDGSIAVIAADADADHLTGVLARAGIATATPDEIEAASRVTVVPATVAKGLEYDHVIVVEPARIAAAEARGLHRLYVVLTRAVSRLDVLHAEPLPAALAGAR
jgi:DNA helicase IV